MRATRFVLVSFINQDIAELNCSPVTLDAGARPHRDAVGDRVGQLHRLVVEGELGKAWALGWTYPTSVDGCRLAGLGTGPSAVRETVA